MRRKIRFGIVGTGGIANTHAAALAALADDAELVACCDVAPERLADFAERWGVRYRYDSARAMLDAGGLDVVGAIRDQRPPAVTGEDGRRVVGIIQGVYESGRSGRPVRLSP